MWSRCDECYRETFPNDYTEIQCTHCGVSFFKKSFIDKPPEEDIFDRDRRYRKKVLAIFSKIRADFQSLEDYDAYLEKIEDEIDGLVKASIVCDQEPESSHNHKQARAFLQ